MHSKNQIFQFGIRQKVVLILVTVLLSALTISAWLAMEQEERDAVKEIHKHGSEITEFMAKSLAYSVVGYDYHTIQLLLDQMTSSQIVAYAKVVNAKGSTMAAAGTLKQAGDPHLLAFHKDIIVDNDIVGHLTTGISPATTLKRLASQKLHLMEREASIILMIAVCEFMALSYLIIRPVRVMSEALGKGFITSGETVGELPVISNDEFGDLARQFNTLGRQLNDANGRLRKRVVSADKQLQLKNRMLTQQSDELQRLNEELKHLSITDPLTGLYNRRFFESMVEAEMAASVRHGNPTSLLLIDIDYFKKVNDTYGHHAGDRVLEEVAGRLKGVMRVSDTLCRLGGEEFVALCKNTNQGRGDQSRGKAAPGRCRRPSSTFAATRSMYPSVSARRLFPTVAQQVR